jgi:hypothetical protein
VILPFAEDSVYGLFGGHNDQLLCSLFAVFANILPQKVKTLSDVDYAGLLIRETQPWFRHTGCHEYQDLITHQLQ